MRMGFLLHRLHRLPLGRSLPSMPEVVIPLEIEPQLRGGSKGPRQPQRHLGRYGLVAIDDRRDSLAGNAKVIGQSVNLETQRLYIVVLKDSSRVNGWSFL